MAKIHELTDVLADQIAAGEVIERPASVVKELVENAIDANSHQIDVLVSQSGFQSIRVIDDGDGIDPDDVAVAFKRHATSKITSREDLFKVHFLGFRGEALPSIASVADVVMTTSTGQNSGTMIHIKGGEIEAQKPAQSRPGTDIKVSDLFFNTPARLKYLKSPQTELAKISDIIDRLALANPDVAISLVHNDKELLKTPGNGNLQQVIAAIYGISNARKMVRFQKQDPDFQVSGFTSLPEVTRAARQYISILINHRYVRNFQLTKAIIAGYGSKLMVGRYPITVLDVVMDPILVDVNVHPAKREVRLSKEEQLSHLITSAIQEQISQKNLIPNAMDNLASQKIDFNQLQQDLNEASTAYEPDTKSTATQETASFDANIQADIPADVHPIMIQKSGELTMSVMTEFDQKYQQEEAKPFNDDDDIQHPQSKAEDLALDFNDQTPIDQKRFPDLNYIGQVHGTFLLAQGADGLYILDQHAAQERINYEYYRQAIGEVSDDQQNLLVPIVLNYPTTDALRIAEKQDVLTKVGLNLENFGQNSFIVRSHPTWFKQGQEEDTIKEMVDWILADGKLTVAQFREKTAIMMSCKRAIKANHYLNDQQAKALLQKLPECENPFNCPHGRPVTVSFTETDLEKMFKRIQDSHSAYAGEFDEHEF
ncbi:DNA mismatch repair endonuclease MutL [Paucilactobacillus sp. N302-9]